MSATPTSSRQDDILRAALPVFGRFGFRKTSMEDLAAAAGLSKQGLYLHFASKEDIFVAAMQRYLDDGLDLVDAQLGRDGRSLLDRLCGAMDAWFGRHIETFAPASFDVIETGDRLSAEAIEGYKTAFRTRLAKALSQPGALPQGNACTPRELAEVLFRFGLTWKEGRQSRAAFGRQIRLCVAACCQLRGDRRGDPR